ncbi:hypothetical protein Tco_0737181 [Tanacetum coccineum]
MPQEDDVLPDKEQPLPVAVSPIADSPGYIPEFDLEEDPEEDNDEDPKENPADYSTNRDDDEKEEPSGDEADNEDEDEDDEEEEEEEKHPTPADSIPPPPRLFALPTPPPSPLTLLLSTLPRIPSSPLPVSPPLPVSSPPPPVSPTYPLGFRAAMIRLKGRSHTITSHFFLYLQPIQGTYFYPYFTLLLSSPPLLLPSTGTLSGQAERKELPCVPTLLMEREARLSREAWGRSMAASDVARYEVMALRTTVLGQQADIIALRAVDCAQQAQLLETLRLMSTLQNEGDACKTSGPNKGSQHISEKMAPKRATSSTPATTTTTTSVINDQLKALIDQGVANALSACDADKSINGDDSHTQARVNYSVENQIKFGTCTRLGSALTWWNSHVKTVGHDVAHAMTWINLKRKMTDKYYPRGKIKKLEVEMFNLKLKLPMWKWISDKRTKNQAKTDKTEHGMEKRGKDKVKSKSKTKKSKSTPEKSAVKPEVDSEEYLMGPPDAIVVPAITADNFELKHGLLTLVGDLVHGLYCRQCALIRKTLEEVFQDFQDTSESSDDDTNFVNENQEPFVVNQDPGKNSSQSPPQINHNCCYECGDSLDGIFCQWMHMISIMSDASPPDAEIVSSEVVEIVITKVGGIDDDILLTIKDDILREKLLNVNLLIANIEALKDNPAPSSDFVTKSSSTSINLFLDETNTFDNSSPESETF